MGRRGPPPKPTKLRIVGGNPGRRPLPKNEPQPRAGVPVVPAWLSKEAKIEWKRIVPELKRLGLLTLVDRAALAAYCQAWAELQEATRLLDKEGRVVEEGVWGKESKDGVRVQLGTKSKLHPAVKLQRDAFARVKAFVGEFGLTPASRTRVKTTGEGDAPAADPLDGLLNEHTA